MTLTTPSGYIVEYNEFLTFGQKRAIDKMYRSNLKMNINNDKSAEMTAEPSLIAEDMAINFLVTKISKDGQQNTSNFRAEMESWKEEDGQAVLDVINAVTTPKKKDVTTSSAVS